MIGEHILGASRGRLCDSSAVLLNNGIGWLPNSPNAYMLGLGIGLGSGLGLGMGLGIGCWDSASWAGTRYRQLTASIQWGSVRNNYKTFNLDFIVVIIRPISDLTIEHHYFDRAVAVGLIELSNIDTFTFGKI